VADVADVAEVKAKAKAKGKGQSESIRYAHDATQRGEGRDRLKDHQSALNQRARTRGPPSSGTPAG
jgi:hypothetical protein